MHTPVILLGVSFVELEKHDTNSVFGVMCDVRRDHQKALHHFRSIEIVICHICLM